MKTQDQQQVVQRTSLGQSEPFAQIKTNHQKLQPAAFGNTAAAVYLGVRPSTLDVWRSTKRYAIPYIKCGRLVKYRQSDLDAWLDSRLVAEGKD